MWEKEKERKRDITLLALQYNHELKDTLFFVFYE